MSSFKKNTAVVGLTFAMISRTDGSDVTTGSATGYITADGNAQTPLTNAPSHLGNGQWAVDLTAGEMNADVVGLLFVHADALPVQFTIRTASKLVSDLNDPSRADITGGSYALDTDANGRVRHAVGTAAGELASTNGAVTVTPEPAVAGAVEDASPSASSFTGVTSLSASDDFYVGSVLAFTSGALKGLARRVTAYAGSTRAFTFAEGFPAAPTDADAFILIGRID